MAEDAREHHVETFARAVHEAGAEPAWLEAIRKEAIGRFAELGFPTTKLEDWKYTSLARVARTPWAPAPEATARLDREAVEALSFPVFACSVFVFVNGRFAPGLSAPRALAGGIQVGSLAQLAARPGSPLEDRLGAMARAQEHALVALNTAFFRDGAFVHVPAGIRIENPIHVVHVTVAGDEPCAVHPRTLVLAEAGSEAVVIEDFVSLGEGEAFCNAVTELSLEEGARIEHVSLLRERERTAHVATFHAHQARDSRLVAHNVSLGGQLTRSDTVSALQGRGAECSLYGFYVATGSQHVDNHTTVEHAEPDCTSRELYKGVLDDAGRGVFNGKVIVQPDAQRTSAQQDNKNLLLSRDAEVDSKPELQIHADDVRCTHGSTIGQIDEDALFFLRTRGIDAVAARALLMRAFATDVTSRISVAPLRDRIDELLLARLTRQREAEG